MEIVLKLAQIILKHLIETGQLTPDTNIKILDDYFTHNVQRELPHTN